MSLYLAYSYSGCLTEKKQFEIDKKVKKSQEEFCKGFRRGTQISLSIYFVYLLATAPAYGADSCPDSGELVPSPPAQSVPTHKPGFKPLSEGTKGAFVGGASAICGAALQSGDFILGLSCAFLLVAGGVIINRPVN